MLLARAPVGIQICVWGVVFLEAAVVALEAMEVVR